MGPVCNDIHPNDIHVYPYAHYEERENCEGSKVSSLSQARKRAFRKLNLCTSLLDTMHSMLYPVALVPQIL